MSIVSKEEIEKFLEEKYKLNEAVGTYVGIKWSNEVAKIITDYAKEHNVPNVIDPKEIHTTLIYSRVGFKHKLSNEDFGFSTIGLNNSRESRLEVFTNEKLGHKALVIKLYSKQIEDRHKQIMKDNPKATYDFDEFIPHITISYDIEDYDINNFDYEQFSETLEDAGGGKEYTKNLDIGKFSNK